MRSKFGSASPKNKSNGLIECQPALDIRFLNQKNQVQNFSTGTLTWKMGGNQICSIGYTVYPDKLTLHFKYRLNGTDWHSANKDIFFETTKCNLGGSRKWFRCNKCGRRVAVLYFFSGEFLCRHCHRLDYASQRENKVARLMRKARKIRSKLGASDNLFEPIWDKPKHMHHNTFDRLKREADRVTMLSLGVSEETYAAMGYEPVHL